MISRRRVIAVDADGVVYDHLARIRQHLKDRWNYFLDPATLHVRNWAQVTGVQEIDLDLLAQVKNPEFYMTMKPMPGAEGALRALRVYADLVLISNRPNHLKQTTYLCCARDFGDDESPTGSVFREVHCYERTPKWRPAKALGAAWAVDDNPKIAEEYQKHDVACFLVGGRKSFVPHRYIKPVSGLPDVVEFFERYFGKKTA